MSMFFRDQRKTSNRYTLAAFSRQSPSKTINIPAMVLVLCTSRLYPTALLLISSTNLQMLLVSIPARDTPRRTRSAFSHAAGEKLVSPHFACFVAKTLPAVLIPAWKMNRFRCIESSVVGGLANVKDLRFTVAMTLPPTSHTHTRTGVA
jgi:hypothetical protein